MRRPLLLLLLIPGSAAAQPFIDVVGVGALGSCRWPIPADDRGSIDGRLGRLDGTLTVPIKINGKGDKIILGAYYERWSILPDLGQDLVGSSMFEQVNGISVPLTHLRTLVEDRWKMSFTGIGRWMSFTADDPSALDGGVQEKTDFQIGGAILASRILRPELTWRFGLYVNNDAFGVFARPLLGIDWRINDRHNLFGVLPNALTYEHKAGRHFHWGLNYRAITASYGEHGGDFRRLDENTLGAFLDFYILPSEFVLRIEAGHSVLSKYRGGEGSVHYDELGDGRYVDYGLGDGPYLRALLAFRVRLDGDKATPGPSPGR